MSAPVHEAGRPVGSLTVASYESGRRYSSIERDMLLAFADHASLALSDARSIQAMREADAARIQARFRSLVNSSSDMITVIDSAGQVVYASPSVERALILPDGGYEGTPLALLIHPDDRAPAIDFLAAVARNRTPAEPVEWRMRATDGSWIEVETIATGRLDDPDVQGIVLNSRNVTERKRLEAQLRQSQRLESVGQLAGGIAHDFNNYLSVIRGYARFLVDGLAEDDPLRSDADEIEKAAERASRLTNQLLVFSRHERVQHRAVDVAEVLSGITSILDRTIGEDVALYTDVERPLRRVEADPTQIEQVLVNLAVNARDAMPSGGEIRIGLANVADGPGGAGRRPAHRPRHGHRHVAGGRGARLRAVLLDQAEGRGHRPRPRDRVRNRDPGARHDRDRLVARLRHDDRGAPAGHGRERARRARAARTRPRAPRTARRSWSWRTRRRSASSPAASSSARATRCSRRRDGRAGARHLEEARGRDRPAASPTS